MKPQYFHYEMYINDVTGEWPLTYYIPVINIITIVVILLLLILLLSSLLFIHLFLCY